MKTKTKPEDRINSVHGDLICLEYVGKRQGNSLYKFKCTICGREKIRAWHITCSKTGLMHSACSRELQNVNPSFRKRYDNMRNRTTNPKYWAYDNYGGRGINSDEFKYFVDFYDAMYASFLDHVAEHGLHNTTLDRIDVNKSYTKDNIRWTTWETNASNKQRTRLVIALSPEGPETVVQNVSAFAREHGIQEANIRHILKGRGRTLKGFRFRYAEV